MSTGQAASVDSWGQQAAEAVNEFRGPVDPFADVDALDTEGVKLGGGLIEIEGAYHLEVADAVVKEELTRQNRHEIRLRLVALHSTPGQSPAGSCMWHGLEIPLAADREVATKSGNMFDALLGAICTFGLGIGLLKKEKTADGKERIVDPETKSTKLNLRTFANRLKGMQCVGRPTRRDWEKDTKKGFNMEFRWGHGVSQVDDPQNAHVPMNEDALKVIGKKRFSGAPTKAPAPPPQPETDNGPKRTQKPAPQVSSDFSDL